MEISDYISLRIEFENEFEIDVECAVYLFIFLAMGKPRRPIWRIGFCTHLSQSAVMGKHFNKAYMSGLCFKFPVFN